LPSDLKLLQHPKALSNAVLRIALEAGNLTLDYFDGIKDMGIVHKNDDSPVTRADQEAETCIIKGLTELAPDIIVVGEELTAEGRAPNPSNSEYFWLVDPLDGTKEFIGGSGEYTVNIALIKNNKPALGVVYAPALEMAYAGYTMKNAKSEIETAAIRLNTETQKEKFIKVRKPQKEGIIIVTSRSHANMAKIESFTQSFKVEKLIKKGSSLKMCYIAEGKADIYPRFGPTCEWDTAAAHAILNAAGGQITDLDSTPLTYGHYEKDFKNPEFIASAFDWKIS